MHGFGGASIGKLLIYTVVSIHLLFFAGCTSAQDTITETIYETVENPITITSYYTGYDGCVKLPTCFIVNGSAVFPSGTGTDTQSGSGTATSTARTTYTGQPNTGFVLYGEGQLQDHYIQFDDENGRLVFATVGAYRFVQLEVNDGGAGLLQNALDLSELVFVRYNQTIKQAYPEEGAEILDAVQEVRHANENDLLTDDFMGTWSWNSADNQLVLERDGDRWVFYVSTGSLLRARQIPNGRASFDLFVLPQGLSVPSGSVFQRLFLAADMASDFPSSVFTQSPTGTQTGPTMNTSPTGTNTGTGTGTGTNGSRGSTGTATGRTGTNTRTRTGSNSRSRTSRTSTNTNGQSTETHQLTDPSGTGTRSGATGSGITASKTGTNTQPRTGSSTGNGGSIGTGTGTGTRTGTETGTETGTGTDTGTGGGTGTGGETGTGGTGTGGTGTGTGTGTGGGTATTNAYEIITQYNLRGYCTELLSYFSPSTLVSTATTRTDTSYIIQYTETSTTYTKTLELASSTAFAATSITTTPSIKKRTKRGKQRRQRTIRGAYRRRTVPALPSELTGYPSDSIRAACSQAATSPTAYVYYYTTTTEDSTIDVTTDSTTTTVKSDITTTTTGDLEITTVPAVGNFKIIRPDLSDTSGAYYGWYIHYYGDSQPVRAGPEPAEYREAITGILWGVYQYGDEAIMIRYLQYPNEYPYQVWFEAVGRTGAQAPTTDRALNYRLFTYEWADASSRSPFFVTYNYTSYVAAPDETLNPVASGSFYVCNGDYTSIGQYDLYFGPSDFPTKSGFASGNCTDTGMTVMQGEDPCRAGIRC
ncbi:hypothetical protein TWF281_004391 [Arthrobotrys megalospora]